MSQGIHHGIRSLSSGIAGASRAIVALGSNLGNRANYLRRALDQMGKWSRVHRTSFLYESAPMYNTDQPSFLNAACEIETDLKPLELLAKLKAVESDLGRDFNAIRNSPRPIDLDIALYNNQNISKPDGELIVPHPRIAEREFVLRPLLDLSDNLTIPSTSGKELSVSELLSSLLDLQGGPGLTRVTPTHTGQLLKWGNNTKLMGIINATPDSFSDGGQLRTVQDVLFKAEEFANAGFDIVDIGGQSTRPGAESVGPEEELRRVTAAISAIHTEFPHLLISCDTYQSSVAKEALSNGAEIINDISAGGLDSNMHDILQKTGAASIQMHTRGDPKTMQALSKYTQTNIAAEAGSELKIRLEKAQDAGISRWSMMIDCGIGFAKQAQGSVNLMRHGKEFVRACGGYPCVLGASRKSWMKGFVSSGAEARDWATAGAIGAAVALGGVDMVRVHSANIADAVRACDAVRNG